MEGFAGLGHWFINIALGLIVAIGAIAAINAGTAVVLSTAYLMFIGPVFVGGILLAYYVPTIPFLIWTAALVGWFIVVIEALVAAPLWILAISRVDGDEGFFGRTGQSGLFLFLGVLIRPFAMLFGLCIAMTAMTFVDKLLIGMFSLFLLDRASMSNYTDLPVITGLIMFFIISATRTTFVHKIFGLVSYLPDVMIQWLGATGHHLGSDQDEQKVSGIVGQSAGHLAVATNMSGKGVGGLAQQVANKQSQAESAQRNQEAKEREQSFQTQQTQAIISAIKNSTSNNQSGFNAGQNSVNNNQNGVNRATKNEDDSF